jgi:hypothetical protein
VPLPGGALQHARRPAQALQPTEQTLDIVALKLAEDLIQQLVRERTFQFALPDLGSFGCFGRYYQGESFIATLSSEKDCPLGYSTIYPKYPSASLLLSRKYRFAGSLENVLAL